MPALRAARDAGARRVVLTSSFAASGPHPRPVPSTPRPIGAGALAADEEAEADETTVAELHDALSRFPEDGYLQSLIEDLLELSPRFAERWGQHPVARTPARKDLRPPRDRGDHA